jgi:MFS family permease
MAIVAAGYVWSLPRGRPGSPLPMAGSLWERGGLDELRHRHMVVTLFFGLGAGTIFVFVPTFADSLGIETLALFYTAFAVAAIGVRVFGGRLIDTHGRRAVIVPSMFVQTGATALLALLGFLVNRTSLTPVVPVLFVIGLMSGSAHGLLYPGLAAMATDHAPETRRGVIVAMFSAVFLVGQTAGSFVFGYVTHAVGYRFMWMMLASFLLLGAALSMRLVERRAA